MALTTTFGRNTRALLPDYLQLFHTPILFSQIDKFFFDRHALTLLGLTSFGKSPADLGSYELLTTVVIPTTINTK